MQPGMMAHVQSTDTFPPKEEWDDEHQTTPGTVLLLEPLEMLGALVFILCAATETFLDMETNETVQEGELRCYASNRLALIVRKGNSTREGPANSRTHHYTPEGWDNPMILFTEKEGPSLLHIGEVCPQTCQLDC